MNTYLYTFIRIGITTSEVMYSCLQTSQLGAAIVFYYV